MNPRENDRRSNRATLLIGLDSYEPRLLRAWAAAGHLPVLQRLLGRGIVAPVRSAPSLYAGTVWSSFATGVSPARHRRFFRRQAPRGSYLDEEFLPTALAVKPFWKGLGDAGKRIAIIDVPHCSLVDDVNGIHIVDWSPHEPDFPAPQFSKSFGQAASPPQAPPRRSCDDVARSADGYRALVRDLAERIQRKVALTRDCLQREPWDLLVSVFGEAHCVGHQCWHLHDPQYPQHDARMAAQVGDPMLSVYQALDAAVGELVDLAAPHTSIMVLLSHGMGPLYGESVVLDEILRRLENESSVRGGAYGRLKQVWYGMPAALRDLPVLQRARRGFSPALHNSMLVPDRMQRRCFAIPNNPHSGAIRINLVGREPQGRVRPGSEYRALCESLRDQLLDLVNPATGNRRVQEVTIVADAYDGPFVDELPDLLVEWTRSEPARAIASPRIGNLPLPQLRGRTGDHRADGLLIAVQPGVDAGERREPIAITDFAATFAANMGLELPDLEGQPIAELTRR